MALPVISNVFRCTWNWRHATKPSAHNILHVKSAGDVFDVANAWDNAFASQANASHMGWAITNGYTLDDIDILPLDGVSGTTNHNIAATRTTSGGTDSIYQGAAVVTLQTGLAGQSRRGRVFLGPVGESAQQDGVIASAGITVMQPAWNALLSGLLAWTTPAELQVASYKLADSEPVSSVVVRTYLGSQRRRARFLQ